MLIALCGTLIVGTGSTPSVAVERPARVTQPLAAVAATTFQVPLFDQPYQADPMMVTYGGNYYLLYNDDYDNHGGAKIRKASSLAGLRDAPDTVVWTPAAGDPVSGTPGIGFLLHWNSKWYAYGYTFVLESAGDDPMGPYSYKGAVDKPPGYTGYANFPFEVNGQLYEVVTNDQNAPNTGNRIFIAKLSNPWTRSSAWTELAAPSTSGWECANGRCIDEGGSAYVRNGKVYFIFSAGGYESPDYCVGMLTASATANLIDKANWTKSPGCVFARNDAAGAYGPASAFWFKSLDGSEDWIAYHVKTTPAINFRGDDRALQVKRVTWNADGSPSFGTPVAADTYQTLPAGDSGVSVFEAEHALVNAASIRSTAISSNGQYVGGIDYSNSSVTFSGVNVPATGTYRLSVTYAVPDQNATQNLSVNGGTPVTLQYPPTGPFGRFGTHNTVQVDVALQSGSNTIAFLKGNLYVELDKIQLVYETMYEAENAAIVNSSVRSNATAYRSQYVGGIDFGDSSVTFRVFVPSAGPYRIDLHNANGTGVVQTQGLTVNGGTTSTVSYPATGPWGQFKNSKDVSLNLTLQAGLNTLRFTKDGYVELDRLTVVR